MPPTLPSWRTDASGTRSGFAGPFINFGTVRLTRSSVEHNTSTIDGGGIYNNFSSTVKLTSSTVERNSANRGDGGGIWNDIHSTVRLSGSTVEQNTAANSGGGIYNSASTVSSIGSAVRSNRPDNCGGPDPVPGCMG